ncbi:hypothetical protein [Corynebacterium gerontici]|uniref:hypothetical protein n=1 Tax=Corynebacterium gerontici TaxID=2079234 RepID=UPI000F511791|nr:hypothetical protein [Corynebacterium gerontici]
MQQLSAGRWWLIWAFTRAIIVLRALQHPWTQGDPKYYFAELSTESSTALQEYPSVAVWPLRLVFWLSQSNEAAFIVLFSVLCLLFDATFFAILRRHHAPMLALGFWCAMGVLMPEMLLWRFDIIPGVLVGLAALYLHHHRSQVLLATAAMMKLWPFALAPAIAGRLHARKTWRNVAVYGTSIAMLGGLTVALGGIERLLSPLSYQGARGVQIESLAATPLMFAAIIAPDRYSVKYAASKSFEITGPGAAVMQHASSLLMLGCALLVLIWLGRALLRGPLPRELNVAWMLLVLLVLLGANKVFSPQYLWWLAPLLAVALMLRPDGLPRMMTWLCLLCALCTSLVYPTWYHQIDHVPFDGLPGAIALVTRNVLLVILMVPSAMWVLREHRAALPAYKAIDKTLN